MKKIARHIPNAITCLNLFLGCVACVMAFQGDYLYAAIFIYIASVLDFLDGLAARLLNAYSSIGKELDSLADAISFGLAPGIILFSWLQKLMPDHPFIAYIAFVIPIFSALRLAKFNVDSRQTTSFIGLPTPANAIFIASLFALCHKPFLLGIFPHDWIIILSNILSKSWIVILIIFTLSFLLVCKLPMFSLKFNTLKWKENRVRYIFLALSLVLLVIFQLVAIPLIIILFILISLVLLLKKND
jgi:CDP-diacylglycerol--serine O-phosphatidyltransferase